MLTKAPAVTTVRACGPRTPRDARGIVEIPVADAWLIWSHEHDAWWAPDFCGYTPNVLGAGLYTRDAADDESRNPAHEKPVRFVDMLGDVMGQYARRGPAVVEAIVGSVTLSGVSDR